MRHRVEATGVTSSMRECHFALDRVSGSSGCPAPRRRCAARHLCRACIVALASLAVACSAQTNVAPLSRVTSSPYVGAAISYLTDGNVSALGEDTAMMAAPLPFRTGHTTPVAYEFTFPQRLTVTRVRLLQRNTQARRAATGFTIEVDTEGDGRYGKTIVMENDARPDVWLAYPVSPPIAAYGLRFRTTAFAGLSGPAYGAPVVEELEIYSDIELARKRSNALPDAPRLEEDQSRAKNLKDLITDPVARGTGQLQRGIFGSMWLYWAAGKQYSEQSNERNMALLRRLRINRYWLYPGVDAPNRLDLPYLTLPTNPDYMHFVARQIEQSPRSAEMTIVPFPSTVVAGHKSNVLDRFVAQMHANGVRVIANQSLLPYGLEGWDFPRVMKPAVYPSVLSSSFVRDASTTLYREFMLAGVDGLALGGDEFFLYGEPGKDESASPICKDPLGSMKKICAPTFDQLFERRFGTEEHAARAQGSRVAAKRKVFEYEQIARLFGNYAQVMKSVNGIAIVTSLFSPVHEDRPSFGIAYDVMGTLGEVDEMGSDPYWSHDSYLGHYYFANETKKLAGASKLRKAVITLQTTPKFDRNGYRDPIMVYGPALSSLMHGASGINFYKHDYLFAGGENDAGPWVEKFFDLSAYLEQKGLLDHRIPRCVALLYSRASEDWWQWAHSSNPIEAAEAPLYQNAVMEVLFRNGVPFDLYYLDQAPSLDEIGKYSIAILPYPYSVSKGAAAKIRSAMDHGTKIVSLQRNGEVDEFGEPYRKPALDGLQGATHLRIDLARTNYDDFSARLMGAISGQLKDRLPLHLNNAGKDVECATLVRDADLLVFCLNWEKDPVEINLGLELQDGPYSVSSITLMHEAPAAIHGSFRLEASELRLFRLALAAGEAKILAVDRVTKSPRSIH